MMLINGRLSECAKAMDRGLAYGDGVFETVAILGGRPRHWNRHWARLEAGCERLGIAPPQQQQVTAEIARLVDRTAQAVIKLTVTRGTGGRGYDPTGAAGTTRILTLHEWPEHRLEWATVGINMHVCRTRLGRNRALAGIKHLNRLEQVLASRERADSDHMEGLMRDSAGAVIEGTRTNVFMLSRGVATTPDLSQCGVEGVMRSVILEVLPQIGVEVQVRRISLVEILQADELFVCNSIIGVWPVRRLAHRPSRNYGIGSVTRGLLAALRARGDIL